jgi:protein involved in polysaccharide export with SLBB domain
MLKILNLRMIKPLSSIWCKAGICAYLFVAGSAVHAQLPPDASTGLIMPPAPAPASSVSASQAAAPDTSRAADTGIYRISPGDELSLRFDFVPEFNTVETVRPDGHIDLPLIGSQRAAGLTADELGKQLKAAYATKLRHPDLSINIAKGFGSQQVFVGGEVQHPGVQPLSPSLTALQAILVAQGFKDTADASKVSILRRSLDGTAQVLSVDTKAVMDGKDLSKDIALQPFDVVIVQPSTVASVNQWIDQYIRRNIPFNTGLSYVINRNMVGN